MFTLRGKFVSLEPLEPHHASALLEAAREGTQDTFKWTWVPTNNSTARAYTDLALADQERGTAIPFATVRLSDNRVIGSTRFMSLERWGSVFSPAPPISQIPDAVEIGATWLAANAQRSSINSEAKLLMLSHAFEVWQVKRVTLKTDARNTQSRAAIERLGAKLDGVLRAQTLATDGTARDSAWYSIVAAEWPALKTRLAAKIR